MPTSQHYQAVIFDLDDTLVQTHAAKWAHHKAVAKEFYDLDITDELLAKHWGMPFDAMISILLNNADTLENMHAAYASTNHRFPKTPAPGAITAVNTLLHSGYRLGVLSAMNRSEVITDLTQLGFPVSQFDLIQGANDTIAHKPDPAVFAPAIAHLATRGITPHQTLYIGDALSDFYAATGAGLGFIGVTTGFISDEQFTAAGAKSVPNLAQLIELLMSAKDPQTTFS